MEFPHQFIRAAVAYTTLEQSVPAPYLRRAFFADRAAKGQIVICGLGFYELYLNGHRITKGRLAPYVSNPDDIIYYDTYEAELTAGENVIGVWLGNGFQNNPGGHIWEFDKASFRGAPQMALRLEYTDAGGKTHTVESDCRWRTAPSPVLFDDYRFGEHCDARLKKPGWNAPGFDDTDWAFAIPAPQPRGECRLCTAEPIRVAREIRPVCVEEIQEGFLYDFGVNTAGVCRLSLNGTPGQRVELLHVERLQDGKPDLKSIWFEREHWERDKPLVHRDVYICCGGENEQYTPTFVYHGFRYVLVSGVTAAQATPALLTMLEMHSDLKECGGFSCSDETANRLQEMTRRSDLSNFYYFPTDCPQREKNGWTGDVMLSAEHILQNLFAENSLREWLRNVVKAQREDGALPGIIPTGGWGMDCYGPAWDGVLTELPYQLYKYRGDLSTADMCAPAILRYLHHLSKQTDENGLVSVGLGDWCTVGRNAWEYTAPLAFTSTVTAKDIADKAAQLFDALGMQPQKAFAAALAEKWRTAVREQLLNLCTMTAAGNCQTTQAMALFYGIFESGERSAAFARLLDMIEKRDGHFDVGVLGARVLFHVLTAYGRSDLAFSMIVRPDYPSYGNWVARGATTLWEDHRREGDAANSRNHHFWGDISDWFMQALAGIRYNPRSTAHPRADICPSFIPQLTHAEGFYISPMGRISAAWERTGDAIVLTVEIPDGLPGNIRLERGFVFENGSAQCKAESGSYRIVCG